MPALEMVLLERADELTASMLRPMEAESTVRHGETSMKKLIFALFAVAMVTASVVTFSSSAEAGCRYIYVNGKTVQICQ